MKWVLIQPLGLKPRDILKIFFVTDTQSCVAHFLPEAEAEAVVEVVGPEVTVEVEEAIVEPEVTE